LLRNAFIPLVLLILNNSVDSPILVQFLLANANSSKGVLQETEFLLLTVEWVTQITCNTRIHNSHEASAEPKTIYFFARVGTSHSWIP